MNVIIAGSRTLHPTDSEISAAVEASGFWVSTVICGDASGVDTAGRMWAEKHGLQCYRYPADWDRYGKSAGPIRNREMASDADALILFWDGVSRGSANMLAIAKEFQLCIHEIRIAGNSR